MKHRILCGIFHGLCFIEKNIKIDALLWFWFFNKQVIYFL
jgi:hypothetical protein